MDTNITVSRLKKIFVHVPVLWAKYSLSIGTGNNNDNNNNDNTSGTNIALQCIMSLK